MEAGELRHRLVIEAPEYTRNNDGEAVISWTPIHTVWGKITPIGGQEKLLAESLKSALTHNILLRRVNCLAANMRIRFGCRIFEIVEIKDDPTFAVSQLLKVSEVLPEVNDGECNQQ